MAFQICDGAEGFKEKDEEDKMPKSQQGSSPPPPDKPIEPKEPQKEYIERPRPDPPRFPHRTRYPSVKSPGIPKGKEPKDPPQPYPEDTACDPWADCPPPEPGMNPKEIDKYYERCCDSLVRVSRSL